MVAWPFIILGIKIPLILIIHACKKTKADKKNEELKEELRKLKNKELEVVQAKEILTRDRKAKEDSREIERLLAVYKQEKKGKKNG